MTPDRTALLAEADSLLHKSLFSKEDSARVEQLIALADACTDRSELRAATLAQHARELGRPVPIPSQPDARFTAYLRQGPSALSLEDRRRIGIEKMTPPLRSSQSEGTGSAGGMLVPQSFADVYWAALKATDGLFELATVWESDTGTASPYPVLEDTSQAATVVAENAQSVDGPDLAFAKLDFPQAKTYRSGLIRATVELVQDSKFNLEALVAASAGRRMARGIGAAHTAALLSSAGLGVTAASTTAIAADEIFSLVDSVDPAYGGPNASFLMRRSTYTALLKLKGAGSGNYLFEPEFDGDGIPTLLGFKVFFSPSMGAMTAGQSPISFGDHSRFIFRVVRGSLQAKVFVEREAEFGRVLYETYWRVDGSLLKSAVTTPVNVLAMHA